MKMRDLVPNNECRIVPKTNKTRNLQYKINLSRTQKYDSYIHSFTNRKRGDFIKWFVRDYKGMQKHTKTEFKKQKRTRA